MRLLARRSARSVPASLAATAVVITALIASLGIGATPAPADVDDFHYRSWSVHYEIGVDKNDRAYARVTETLVPVFPMHDQNRGIIRALPLTYQDANAAPSDISVTDEHGEPVPFEVDEDSTFRAILVGDDRYVHGETTYVITYTVPDVILAAEETGVDEFYWDIVPLERRQPIETVSAEISFLPPLTDRLTGASACYIGGAGSTDRCTTTITEASDGAASVLLEPTELPARNGITVAVAIEPGLVAQPPSRLPHPVANTVPFVVGGGALATGIAAVFPIAALKRRRRVYRGTVVAQYDVPPHFPPLIVPKIIGSSTSAIPAEFVHLAVSGAMRIEDSEPSAVLKKTRPAFRLLDPGQSRDPLDGAALAALFPSLQPGTVMTVPKDSSTFSSSMTKLRSTGAKAAQERGYLTKERSRPAQILGIIALALLLPFLGFTAYASSLTTDASPFGVFAVACVVIAGTFGILGISKHQVHTPLGAEAREYLEGVREFIRVAEADRIRMLQSYSGAERRPDGSVDVIHLYERLLPYAMLFGLEKEWTRVLEVTYTEGGVTSPYWYPALGIHGISSMERTFSSFSSSVSSAASYTSSSSGGSSGGGFSGGGGGGGFSGGR